MFKTINNNYTKLLISILLFTLSLIVVDIFISFQKIKSAYHSYLDLILLAALVVVALIVFKIKSSFVTDSNLKQNNEIALQQKEIERLNKLIINLTNLYNDAVEYDRQKTEFFSNLSHELKTPISVILGAIQLMEQKRATATSERRHSSKQLQTIKHNCYRLLRLINNILDISKIDSGYIKTNMQNCNIVYLIEEIAQSVVPYAEQKGLSLEFDTEVEEIITAVDIDKIERIALNLLSNAIKFTPSGGKILVNVLNMDNKVLISVKDTGVGIPRNMQNKIFDRFQQVDSPLTRKFEGSGIGLSLVKSFVSLHDGSITVNSELNKGSEFIVELPISLCNSTTVETAKPYNNQTKIIEAINIEFSDIYSVAS